jgi:hypothetical protein
LGFARNLADVADVEVAPEKVGAGDGDGEQIAAIDGDAGPLRRGGFAFVLFVPLAQADIPQSQRLEGGRFARVVRADEDHRLAQFDVGVRKSLEILDSQPCQHGSEVT